MNFISNSQDILFIVLAFCALWLTVFLVWFLYYAVMTIKQGYEAVRQTKEKIDMVDEVITTIREKVTSTASYLTLIIAGVRKMIDLLGSNKEEKKSRNKR